MAAVTPNYQNPSQGGRSITSPGYEGGDNLYPGTTYMPVASSTMQRQLNADMVDNMHVWDQVTPNPVNKIPITTGAAGIIQDDLNADLLDGYHYTYMLANPIYNNLSFFGDGTDGVADFDGTPVFGFSGTGTIGDPYLQTNDMVQFSDINISTGKYVWVSKTLLCNGTFTNLGTIGNPGIDGVKPAGGPGGAGGSQENTDHTTLSELDNWGFAYDLTNFSYKNGGRGNNSSYGLGGAGGTSGGNGANGANNVSCGGGGGGGSTGGDGGDGGADTDFTGINDGGGGGGGGGGGIAVFITKNISTLGNVNFSGGDGGESRTLTANGAGGGGGAGGLFMWYYDTIVGSVPNPGTPLTVDVTGGDNNIYNGAVKGTSPSPRLGENGDDGWFEFIEVS